MKPRGLVPNFHTHVSVNDLYTPTIGPPTVFCCRIGIANEVAQLHFREYLFRIFGTVSLQCTLKIVRVQTHMTCPVSLIGSFIFYSIFSMYLLAIMRDQSKVVFV
jgi:hypothetical protein